jgi:hypothetical protein
MVSIYSMTRLSRRFKTKKPNYSTRLVSENIIQRCLHRWSQREKTFNPEELIQAERVSSLVKRWSIAIQFTKYLPVLSIK